jgi:hypothetical protein
MVKIKKLESKKEMMEFIKFPWLIYKNDKNWVSPLIDDVKFTLTENPFWEHAEQALFMAYDDSGNPLGRIAGIIDRNYIEFQDENAGFFGFFECINDKEIAQALFDQVKSWLVSKGIKLMRGPMNPSTNDEIGFLCQGFESSPRLMMPYNPSYYLELAEKCGLKYAKEVYAYNMLISDEPLKRLERVSKIAYAKVPGLTVRKLDTKNFEEEIEKAVEVYNLAWEKNWGFVPWTKKEFYTIAKRLKDLLLLDTTLLAEIGGKPVGMLIAVPDYNFVMQKMNGRLFPFGILKFLYYKSKIKALRLMIMGVVKDYRQRGIEGIMYCEALKNSMKNGFKECEFSWILEDNVMTQRAAEMMGGHLYKKYRIYETVL